MKRSPFLRRLSLDYGVDAHSLSLPALMRLKRHDHENPTARELLEKLLHVSVCSNCKAKDQPKVLKSYHPGRYAERQEKPEARATGGLGALERIHEQLEGR